MYCKLPSDLLVQYIEHLCTCYAESQMNTKTIYVLLEWPQFIYVNDDLKLSRQISAVRLLFEKETYLSLSFLAYFLWVFDKNI